MSSLRSASRAWRCAKRAGLVRLNAKPRCCQPGNSARLRGPNRARPGCLDQAVQRSTGVHAARVLARRGVVLWALGRYPAALEDLRRAVVVLRRAGDLLWTARALNNRGLVYLALGSTSRADADFVSAERLFREIGQELEASFTVVNRALAAFASGDLRPRWPSSMRRLPATSG